MKKFLLRLLIVLVVAAALLYGGARYLARVVTDSPYEYASGGLLLEAAEDSRISQYLPWFVSQKKIDTLKKERTLPENAEVTPVVAGARADNDEVVAEEDGGQDVQTAEDDPPATQNLQPAEEEPAVYEQAVGVDATDAAGKITIRKTQETTDGITLYKIAGPSYLGDVMLIDDASRISLAAKGLAEKVILTDSAGIKPRRSASYYAKVYSYKAMKKALSLPGLRGKKEEILERQRSKKGSADYNAASPTMRRILSTVVNEDLTPELDAIRVPTLLVWGSEDTATPLSDGEEMEGILKKNGVDTALIVFPGRGHFAFLEEKNRFISVCKAFI